MYREFEEFVFNNYDIKDKGIALKFYHSKRVAIISKRLAELSGWNLHDTYLATQIGLLHDIARFYEVKLFRSFAFTNNFDHGKYGVYFLKRNNYYEKFGIIENDKETVFASIFYHNKLKVSKKYQNNKFCKLIRDADKIDILYILSQKWDYGDDFKVSPKVLEAFKKKKAIKNKYIKTEGDKILFYISYIFDLNYDISCKYLKESNYIDIIYEHIPYKELFEAYFRVINSELERRSKNVRY